MRPEYLSESARKAKRNLIFFAGLGWAVAIGGLSPTDPASPIALPLLGISTNAWFAWSALLAAQLYNIAAFYLYTNHAEVEQKAYQYTGERNIPLPQIGRPSGKNFEEHEENVRKYKIWHEILLHNWEIRIPFWFGVSGPVGILFSLVQIYGLDG